MYSPRKAAGPEGGSRLPPSTTGSGHDDSQELRFAAHGAQRRARKNARHATKWPGLPSQDLSAADTRQQGAYAGGNAGRHGRACRHRGTCGEGWRWLGRERLAQGSPVRVGGTWMEHVRVVPAWPGPRAAATASRSFFFSKKTIGTLWEHPPGCPI